MLKFLLISCFFSTSFLVQAQVPDFISVKKRNGITVQHFYAGMPITFETQSMRTVDGMIDKIADDSVYIRFYHVVVRPSVWGTRLYDTAAAYIIAFHYKEIKSVQLTKLNKRVGNIGKLGGLLIIGGTGYCFLNVTNSLIYNQPVFTDRRNAKNLAIAAGTAGAGYLLRKIFNPKGYNDRRLRIVYMRMQ